MQWFLTWLLYVQQSTALLFCATTFILCMAYATSHRSYSKALCIPPAQPLCASPSVHLLNDPWLNDMQIRGSTTCMHICLHCVYIVKATSAHPLCASPLCNPTLSRLCKATLCKVKKLISFLYNIVRRNYPGTTSPLCIPSVQTGVVSLVQGNPAQGKKDYISHTS